MRILNYEITRQGITRIKEQFRGTVDLAGGKRKEKRFYIGEHTWRSRCHTFERMYQLYPMLKQGILTLSGIVMSEGVYTRPAEQKPKPKKNEPAITEAERITYALAEEAQWRVDNTLHKKFRINSMFYNTVNIMGKFGSCFWEKTDTPEFAFRLIPNQETIEPAMYNDIGEVTKWRQVIHGTEKAQWNSSEIVHFIWNPSSKSWPYGTPLLVGLDVETEALLGLEESAKDYMEKEAWPYEILALGDAQNLIVESDYNVATRDWTNRKAGDGFTTRNIPVDLKQGGTGSTPLRELSSLMELMKDNIQDGLMVPAISKLYNSTEASANVMTKHVMTVLGQPIQWILKEQYENGILKPYMDSLGFSVKSTPELIFESPDVHKEEEGKFWVDLVAAKIQTPQQAADHLGLEFDAKYWTKQEEQMLKQQQDFNKEDNGTEKENPLQELVTLKESVIDRPVFMKRCVSICSELVSDPTAFCGAFWNDGSQVYHGPVKTGVTYEVHVKPD